MNLLFLDVDGVLNDHVPFRNNYNGIHSAKLYLLDWIVRKTGCKIVLASAWRYMIIQGVMTLKGFQHILAIHGAAHPTTSALIDYLPADVNEKDPHDRAKLARAWLDAHPEFTRAVALDDLEVGYQEYNIDFVRTDGRLGLTDAGAEEVVRLFGVDL